jgi:putative DNA primase/helicase
MSLAEDKQSAASDLPYASEMALAEAFSQRSRGRFRWSPGLDWMRNTGTHWERDSTLERYSLAKAVCRDAAKPLGEDRMRYRLTAASTVNSVVGLAKSEPAISTPVEEWDASPMLLNTRDGAYDLRTGRRVDSGKNLFTQVTSIAPDSNMETPVWSRFLSDIFAADVETIEFIQRMAGYCLTGDVREQKLFFMHGAGANGKSVLIDALAAVMGSYSHNLPAEALMSRRGDEHPTIFASLFGKRLAISSELEDNAHWAEAKIKELTGNETISARFMRQDFFTFRISHKHLVSGNFRPRLKGDDYAMARRMVLIPFEQTFEGSRRDPLLARKLRNEYPGILSWCIAGARKWAESGLRVPAHINDASQSYIHENDDLALWIEDCCEVGKGLQGASAELYASFAQWKDAAGEKAPSQRAFSQRLARKGFEPFRNRAARGFSGLMLKIERMGYAQASRGF